jgi:hypothetical protein
VRATFTEGLEDAGLQAADFSDPREALSPLEATILPVWVANNVDPDSIMNGFDVAVAAHNRWPSIRIILISGLPTDHRPTRSVSPEATYLHTFAADNRGSGEGIGRLLAGLGSA